jgi:N-acetylmuramoyl-L-alanine amidase
MVRWKRMARFIRLVVVLCIMAVWVGAPAQETMSVQTRDGRTLSLTIRLLKNSPHVSLAELRRFMSEAKVGIELEWDETFGLLRITRGAENNALFLDKTNILVNNEVVRGTEPMRLVGGEIFIPISSLKVLSSVGNEFIFGDVRTGSPADMAPAILPTPPPSKAKPEFTSAPEKASEPLPPRRTGAPYLRVAIDPATEPLKWDRVAGGASISQEEWTFNLAQKIKSLLEREGNIEVILTADRGEKITPDEKIRRINRSGADALIALRLDASEFESQGGIEIIVASASLDLSASERTRIETRPNPPTAADYIPYQEGSLALGTTLLEELGHAVAGRVEPVTPAPAYLLRRIAMPSVILSCGYVSNPTDAGQLRRAGYQETLARAITSAISKFRKIGQTDSVVK